VFKSREEWVAQRNPYTSFAAAKLTKSPSRRLTPRSTTLIAPPQPTHHISCRKFSLDDPTCILITDARCSLIATRTSRNMPVPLYPPSPNAAHRFRASICNPGSTVYPTSGKLHAPP